jgi:ketosteroid isomerase-like protein
VALIQSGDEEHQTSDEALLTEMNTQYVDAFMRADVGWYRQHLADDFVCIESNGEVLDKLQFLRQTANGPNVQSYQLEHVRVRILGDVALVYGTGVFTNRDGTTGTSRYTDVYAKTDGAWKAISAQITHAKC